MFSNVHCRHLFAKVFTYPPGVSILANFGALNTCYPSTTANANVSYLRCRRCISGALDVLLHSVGMICRRQWDYTVQLDDER